MNLFQIKISISLFLTIPWILIETHPITLQQEIAAMTTLRSLSLCQKQEQKEQKAFRRINFSPSDLPLSKEEEKEQQERAYTWYFSIRPLDNWVYNNVHYGPSPHYGCSSNNAIEMFPSKFRNTFSVYALIAQDEHFTMKNAQLKHYVNQKMINPNLKYIDHHRLLETEDIDMNMYSLNSTNKVVKLTYDYNWGDPSPDKRLIIVLYLMEYENKFYSMVYSTKPYLFDRYLADFEDMIKTFKAENFK